MFQIRKQAYFKVLLQKMGEKKCGKELKCVPFIFDNVEQTQPNIWICGGAFKKANFSLLKQPLLYKAETISNNTMHCLMT